MLGVVIDSIFTSCCGDQATVCTDKYELPSEAPTPLPTAPPPVAEISDNCAAPADFSEAANPGTIPQPLLDILYYAPTCTANDGEDGATCDTVHGPSLNNATACHNVLGCQYTNATKWTAGSCGDLGSAVVWMEPDDENDAPAGYEPLATLTVGWLIKNETSARDACSVTYATSGACVCGVWCVVVVALGLRFGLRLRLGLRLGLGLGLGSRLGVTTLGLVFVCSAFVIFLPGRRLPPSHDFSRRHR